MPTGADDRPNILFILCDQLRARSVGCYGDSQVRTPNLDRLAQEGVRFDAAYSTYPICTPARASVQTGLMPTACHVVWNNQTLDPAYPSLAEHLRRAGYRRAYIGKWHLGGYEGPQGHDYRYPIKRTHRHGWDDVFVVTHGEDYRPGHSPTIIGDRCGLRFDEWQPIWQTNEALKFLAHAPPEHPWILNVNYAIPHEPYFMPEPYRRMYDPKVLRFPPNAERQDAFREELAHYYGLIAWLDDEVGRLLEAVKAQRRRTVILFTSDHGWNLGSPGLPAKFSLYEESACIPLIIADPARPGGRICREPVSLVDIMPTLLDMAGLPPPEGIHGQSLTPLLDREDGWNRKSVFLQIIEHPNHNFERWDPPSRAVRSRRWKYIQRRDRELLFDLDSDPFEMCNLDSDPSWGAVVEEHRAELARWVARTEDPWPGSAMQGVYYNVGDNPFGEMQAHPPRA